MGVEFGGRRSDQVERGDGGVENGNAARAASTPPNGAGNQIALEKTDNGTPLSKEEQSTRNRDLWSSGASLPKARPS